MSLSHTLQFYGHVGVSIQIEMDIDQTCTNYLGVDRFSGLGVKGQGPGQIY